MGQMQTTKIREEAIRATGSAENLEAEIERLLASDESFAPVLAWSSREIDKPNHDLPRDPITPRDFRMVPGAARALAFAYICSGAPPVAAPSGVERDHLRVVADATKERTEEWEDVE